MVGEHARMQAGLFGSILRTPGVAREERDGARARRARCWSYVGLREAPSFDQLAINLSYGDQRRVEIARALASDPKLLLLDEPTAGMNPQESGALTEFMGRLREERGSHDPAHRARHEGRDGRVGAHHGARPRREDRRGRARRRSARTRASSRPTSGTGGLTAMALLEVDDIHTYYGNIEALKGVSLTVEEGEIVTLIGVQRRGQVDHAAVDLGPHAAARGDRSASTGEEIVETPPQDDRRGSGISPVARGPPLLPADDRAREPRPGRLPAPRRATSTTTWTGSSSSSRGSRSASARRRARCPAASSRCWRSAAR